MAGVVERVRNLLHIGRQATFVPPLDAQPVPTGRKPCPVIEQVRYDRAGRVGEPFTVSVFARLRGGQSECGGITVLFPDAPENGRGVTVVLESMPLASRVHVIARGDPVYSADSLPERILPAEYLMCERWREPWRAGDAHELTVYVTPHTAGPLRFYATAWAIQDLDDTPAVRDPVKSQVRDHQGHLVYPFTVSVGPTA